jgi:hypothetical protein
MRRQRSETPVQRKSHAQKARNQPRSLLKPGNAKKKIAFFPGETVEAYLIYPESMAYKSLFHGNTQA